jgi:hypothetical protein
MTTFVITPDELPKVLAAHAKKLPACVKTGALKAAHRARAELVRVSPVDQGLFKNAWRVTRGGPSGNASVDNDSPIAGVIELGARPHPVSLEGIAAIAAWAKRKLIAGASRKKYAAWTGRKPAKGKRASATGWAESWADREARSIAYAIAAKLKKQGQKGLFLVQSRQFKFSGWFAEEVAREVAKVLQAKYGGP